MLPSLGSSATSALCASGICAELRMPGFVGDDVDDIALGQHLAGVLGRRPERFVAQLLARPGQPVPVDLRRSQGLHVRACAPVGDRHHDRGRQVADRGVLVDQVVEVRLAVRRQVHVPGGPAPAVAAVVLDESDAHGAIGARSAAARRWWCRPGSRRSRRSRRSAGAARGAPSPPRRGPRRHRAARGRAPASAPCWRPRRWRHRCSPARACAAARRRGAWRRAAD